MLLVQEQRNCIFSTLHIPLKHERHAVLADLVRFQLSVARTFERIRVWAVGTHHIVQTSTTGLETTSSLRIVAAANQTHELGHGVAVVPWGTESVLGNEPAGREDDKVGNGSADMIGGTSQDSVDGWIGVVKRDRPNGVESAQIVLVWVVVAMPGDHVERGVNLACRKQGVVELAEQFILGGLLFVVKGSDGGLEIASIGQTVGSNGTQLGQLIVTLV